MCYNNSGGGTESADICNARRFIEENSSGKISLNEVAKLVGISPTHLSEKFKQVTGIKFVDYVAGVRFAKAKTLLETTELRITEIAFEAGFQSLSQFNRVFKRLCGSTPRVYRAQIAQKAKGQAHAPMNKQ